MERLLTRDDFREAVFKRDNHTCVICGLPAVDAHHILERRLFTGHQAGGYYLSNGASVCAECHLRCESTDYSVEMVRTSAGIKNPTIPDHLDPNQKYDKWGNCVLADGHRLKGELFHDESVQKILAKGITLEHGKVLELFIDRVKYPRTFHMPFSPGVQSDDKVIKTTKQFEGRRVILTEKMDGENTTMYRDGLHARSLDSAHHPSRDWVKRIWSEVSWNIPDGWRVCGENLYAQHSIVYDSLESYFYVFSIWNQHTCLSWDDTVLYAEVLGLPLVRVIYDGIYDEAVIRKHCESIDSSRVEGAVLRLADSFSYGDFKTSAMKYVREDHVQTDDHWMHQAIKANGLKVE